MSHRTVIFSAVKVAFQDPEARAQFSTAQLARVDSICTQNEPCDDDFRYLQRLLARAYCADD